MKTEEIHQLTVAKIARLTGEYNAQRQSRAAELAGLFSAAESGQPEPQPATDRAETVRGRALEMLNGYAPAGLKLPAAVSRRHELEIEIEAIDLVLSTLAAKENIARAEEAAAFAVKHGDQWEGLCADIILTATRLQALEARAADWRAGLGGAVPSSLPMARFVGTGRSVLNIAWGADPLSRVREAALAARIVTPKELKAASDV
jgi:hypothetical protein